VEPAQMAQGIGLSVWSAISDFHAIGTGPALETAN